MSTPTMRVPTPRKHGKTKPVIPPRFGKVSAVPVLDDLLAAATAVSLDLATSQVKHLARAGAISPQSASRWRIEGKGNPLFDLTKADLPADADGPARRSHRRPRNDHPRGLGLLTVVEDHLKRKAA